MARTPPLGATRVSSLGRCRAATPSDEHGFDFPGRLLPRPLTDQLTQPRNPPQPPKPILEVGPKAHPQLPARLLQAGKRVPTAPPRRAPRAAADLPLLHILPDVPLRTVVVQRYLGTLQHPQQVGPVGTHLAEHLVDAGEAHVLSDQEVEPVLQGFL